MSAGNDSKVKFALFSTFHRVLNDIIVSEGTAKFLIILQVVQLIAMIMNDSNTVVSEHLDANLLKYMNIFLIYPFFSGL